MAQGVGSFIPKRSTGRVSPTRPIRRIYILSYVAYVLFFGTLLSVVGIFFLEKQAEKQLASYIARVDEERRAFDSNKINAIRRLDLRLRTAERILNWHLAPSRIFEDLEAYITKRVQLTSFTYTYETGSDAMVSVGGTTDTFDALLFQRELLRESSVFSKADMSLVTYGSPAALLEEAEREELVALPGPRQRTTVSFVFKTDAVRSAIGYAPRGSVPAVAPAPGASSNAETSTSL